MSPERVERLKVIAAKMNEIILEITPKWIQLSHLHKEMLQIKEELQDETER